MPYGCPPEDGWGWKRNGVDSIDFAGELRRQETETGGHASSPDQFVEIA